MAKTITILGSTGSIGVQSCAVAAHLGYRVLGLGCGTRADLLEAQIRRFRPQYAAIADPTAVSALKTAVADTETQIIPLEELAAQKADIVLNAVVGVAGLPLSVCALQADNSLALANKESLVAGGALLTNLAKKKNLPLLPVDSEHSAIFQCLQGCRKTDVQKLILTASGGPFFGKTRRELENVTPQDALRHPTWQMGGKITVDSATLFNKALELIEAAWLFDLPETQIEVVVHRQSIVHSLVALRDGAVLAQLGVPDMRVPIQFAFTYPERAPGQGEALSLLDGGALTFEAPDENTFPALSLARAALRQGGFAGAVLNAANEEANLLFRQGKIGFLRIADLVRRALDRVPPGDAQDLAAILTLDASVRAAVRTEIGA